MSTVMASWRECASWSFHGLYKVSLLSGGAVEFFFSSKDDFSPAFGNSYCSVGFVSHPSGYFRGMLVLPSPFINL